MFHRRRLAAIDQIFEMLLARAEAEDSLRPGLNRQVLWAYFFAGVTRMMEDPALGSLGLSIQEICQTVPAIFLHDILREVAGE